MIRVFEHINSYTLKHHNNLRGHMVRTKLQRCKDCEEYGLGDICKHCDGKMETVAPLKYSPEDPQGTRRRQRVDAGSDIRIESLPTPRKVIEGEEEE